MLRSIHGTNEPLMSLSKSIDMHRLAIAVSYTRFTRAIGFRGALPWPKLPTDLTRFKQLTSNHAIIMGRKTFESKEISSVPLPNRRNVVLSRDPGWASPAGVVHASDWDEALYLADAGFGGAGYDNGESVPRASDEGNDVFVIGGESLYDHALSNGCRWIFATEIDGLFDADTFFPELGPQWKAVPEEECPRKWARTATMKEDGLTYSFATYRSLEP